MGSAQALSSEELYSLFRSLGSLGPVREWRRPARLGPIILPSCRRTFALARSFNCRCSSVGLTLQAAENGSQRDSTSIFHPSGRKLGGLSSKIDHTWETAGWLY